MRWLLLLLWLSACPKAAPPSSTSAPVTVIAVGDISGPALGAQAQTAQLVDAVHPAAILMLGDAQYPDGSLDDFNAFFEPTWGRHKALIEPVPGNHEYKSGTANGYFTYFGARAGDPTKGYRSFDLGDWHVVGLNTNHECRHVACDENSEQLAWLEADLAKTTKKCVLAYWHHPRFNSGSHGDFTRAAPIWKVLERHRVDLVLNGHEHVYERLGPVNADGAPTPDGIVQLTIGTGGIGFSGFTTVHPASAVRAMATYGVMKLELDSSGWTADFLPVPGSDFRDHASGACR